MKKEKKLLVESGIRNLSLNEEATKIIDSYLKNQLLSDTEIATILLSFQQGILSSDENNPAWIPPHLPNQNLLVKSQ